VSFLFSGWDLVNGQLLSISLTECDMVLNRRISLFPLFFERFCCPRLFCSNEVRGFFSFFPSPPPMRSDCSPSPSFSGDRSNFLFSSLRIFLHRPFFFFSDLPLVPLSIPAHATATHKFFFVLVSSEFLSPLFFSFFAYFGRCSRL